jgi:hypothetical protein
MAAFAALAAFAPASAAERPTPNLRVEQAEGWAEVLALCDLTRFILTADLSADVILRPDPRGGDLEPYYAPRFRPPHLLADTQMTNLYDRLERRGDVTRSAVARARAAVDGPMIEGHRILSSEKRRRLEDQSATCHFLADEVRRQVASADKR